ncbi:unnamed protein product [Protopolystoma xenopodis]|uniref:G-protein coupled receptors family 1 profile domain-containing protein n=1 Tax=Protopolystoma xenopodis TaxID=117903 RepID=A0A3S5ANT6_9PLAT|nr:unnamed protein product [Protopolystoma xenopodis]
MSPLGCANESLHVILVAFRSAQFCQKLFTEPNNQSSGAFNYPSSHSTSTSSSSPRQIETQEAGQAKDPTDVENVSLIHLRPTYFAKSTLCLIGGLMHLVSLIVFVSMYGAQSRRSRRGMMADFGSIRQAHALECVAAEYGSLAASQKHKSTFDGLKTSRKRHQDDSAETVRGLDSAAVCHEWSESSFKEVINYQSLYTKLHNHETEATFGPRRNEVFQQADRRQPQLSQSKLQQQPQKMRHSGSIFSLMLCHLSAVEMVCGLSGFLFETVYFSTIVLGDESPVFLSPRLAYFLALGVLQLDWIVYKASLLARNWVIAFIAWRRLCVVHDPFQAHRKALRRSAATGCLLTLYLTACILTTIRALEQVYFVCLNETVSKDVEAIAGGRSRREAGGPGGEGVGTGGGTSNGQVARILSDPRSSQLLPPGLETAYRNTYFCLVSPLPLFAIVFFNVRLLASLRSWQKSSGHVWQRPVTRPRVPNPVSIRLSRPSRHPSLPTKLRPRRDSSRGGRSWRFPASTRQRRAVMATRSFVAEAAPRAEPIVRPIQTGNATVTVSTATTTRIVVVIGAVFAFCETPYFIAGLINRSADNQVEPPSLYLLHFIGLANTLTNLGSILNFFIYYGSLANFRHHLLTVCSRPRSVGKST